MILSFQKKYSIKQEIILLSPPKKGDTMFRLCCLFVCLTQTLLGHEYDCIVVGSSPFSLLEACYQSNTGKKVLITEKDSVVGGAWQTINILGVPNADLGCHWIHENPTVFNFLKDSVKCDLEKVPIDFYETPERTGQRWGNYLSHGCCEFIENLKCLLGTTDAELRLGTAIDRVIYDSIQNEISVEIDGQVFCTDHVVLTSFSEVCVQVDEKVYNSTNNSFFHLYFLTEDSSDPKFGYMVGCRSIPGVSRIMNMSSFVGLAEEGKQLIALQISEDQYKNQPEIYFNYLKGKGWIGKDAVFLKAETFRYDQGVLPQIDGIPSDKLTVLQSRVLSLMSNYIERWNEAF